MCFFIFSFLLLFARKWQHQFHFFLRFSHFSFRPFCFALCARVHGRVCMCQSRTRFRSAPYVCAVCARLFIFINWVKYISLFDTFHTTLDAAI